MGCISVQHNKPTATQQSRATSWKSQISIIYMAANISLFSDLNSPSKATTFFYIKMLNIISWGHKFSIQNPLCQSLNFPPRKPGLESPIWPSWGESSRMFCSFLESANTSTHICLLIANIFLIWKMHKSFTDSHTRINKQWEYELSLQPKGIILGKSLMHLAEILKQPPSRASPCCSIQQGRDTTLDSEKTRSHCSLRLC